MCSNHQQYNTIDEFLTEWDKPDDLNVPVDYSVYGNETLITIFQPRKSRIYEIVIAELDTSNKLDLWNITADEILSIPQDRVKK